MRINTRLSDSQEHTHTHRHTHTNNNTHTHTHTDRQILLSRAVHSQRAAEIGASEALCSGGGSGLPSARRAVNLAKVVNGVESASPLAPVIPVQVYLPLISEHFPPARSKFTSKGDIQGQVGRVQTLVSEWSVTRRRRGRGLFKCLVYLIRASKERRRT